MSDVKSILQEVHHEYSQQPHTILDQGHSRNDWIAIIFAYVGRCGAKVVRNRDENYRANLVKAAAVAVRAIEAHDKGWC